MKRSEALQLLESTSPHDRLRAARSLLATATRSDERILGAALAAESVSWVRTAIERVLDRLRDVAPATTAAPREDTQSVLDDTVLRALKLKASEELFSSLVHEITPRIGFIRNAAKREIGVGFDHSDTKVRIEQLEDLMSLLVEFRGVSQQAKFAQFDLAELIDGAVTDVGFPNTGKAGPRPLLVIGDQRRVRLAVINGLKNGAESIQTLGNLDGRIVINWGISDNGYWISIVDEGVGIRGNVEGMFGLGSTTKAHHFGMGLPLARQAMLSMDGEVALSAGAQRGARFDITWARPTDSGEVSR